MITGIVAGVVTVVGLVVWACLKVAQCVRDEHRACSGVLRRGR